MLTKINYQVVAMQLNLKPLDKKEIMNTRIKALVVEEIVIYIGHNKSKLA